MDPTGVTTPLLNSPIQFFFFFITCSQSDLDLVFWPSGRSNLEAELFSWPRQQHLMWWARSSEYEQKKTTTKKHRKWRLKVFSLFVRTTLLRPSLQALRQQAAGRDWLFEPLLLYKSADCARELQSRRDGAVDTVRSSGGRGGGGNTRKKSEQHQQQSESKENQRRLNGCRIIDRKKSSR